MTSQSPNDPSDDITEKKRLYQMLTSAGHYQERSIIGVGGAGGHGFRSRVVLAYCEKAQENVAIKIVDLDKVVSDPQWGNLTKETTILSQMRHDNLVHSYCTFQHKPEDGVNELWIVMPVMAGSCNSILKNWRPNGIKDEHILAFILQDTLKGLDYLHEQQFIHRDLKASNVLIGMDGVAKIADFALSSVPKEFDRKNTAKTLIGTPCWIAPEVWRGDRYNNKADIWSFGVLCMELAFGRPPYAHLDHYQIMTRVIKDYQEMEEIYGDDDVGHFSPHFRNMVKKCLKHEPDERPSAKELLKSKFFQKAETREYVMQCVKPMLNPKTNVTGDQELVPKSISKSVQISVEEHKHSTSEAAPSFVFGRFTVTDTTPESSPHTSEVKTSSDDHHTPSQKPERKRSSSSGVVERVSPSAVEKNEVRDQVQRTSSSNDLLTKNSLRSDDLQQHGRFQVAPEEPQDSSSFEPKPNVSDWNEDDVVRWLNTLGSDYGQYEQQFKNNGIDGDMLLVINEDMLAEITVEKSVHRKKIMNSIKKLQKGIPPVIKENEQA